MKSTVDKLWKTLYIYIYAYKYFYLFFLYYTLLLSIAITLYLQTWKGYIHSADIAKSNSHITQGNRNSWAWAASLCHRLGVSTDCCKWQTLAGNSASRRSPLIDVDKWPNREMKAFMSRPNTQEISMAIAWKMYPSHNPSYLWFLRTSAEWDADPGSVAVKANAEG